MKFAWIQEPPFNFLNAGSPAGCDVAVARHLFDAIGETFEPIETEFADLLPGLKADRWAVTTGMFVTAERRMTAAFTRPIWSLRDALLSRRDHPSAPMGYRHLAESGGRLAVLEGQVQHATALSLGVRPEAIVVYRTFNDAAAAVAAGEVDAYASVELAHRAWVAMHRDFSCKLIPDEEKAPDDGGFACRSPELRDRLDLVLTQFIGSPEHLRLLQDQGLDPASLGF
jgi:polar amino acid transport system substrate-binding protein